MQSLRSGRQRQENHSKFEASLVFVTSSRVAWTTWQDPVIKELNTRAGRTLSC